MADAPARDRKDEDQDQVDPEATDPATDPVEDDEAVETTEELPAALRTVEDEDEAKDRGKS